MASIQPTGRGGGLDGVVVVAAADAEGDAKPDTADAAAAGGGGGGGGRGPSDSMMMWKGALPALLRIQGSTWPTIELQNQRRQHHLT